jgi:DNA processing protein
MEHAIEKIALTLIDGVGPVTSRQLISYIGDTAGIFRAKKRELLAIPGIGEKTVETLVHHREAFARAEEEWAFIQKHQIKALFYTDKGYPYRLKAYEDSPVLLYYKGTVDLDHQRIVSIIGTRSPTDLGKMLCEKLIEDMMEYQVIVVSGLAYGVDITAHRKCIELQLPTIGVMGNGLDKIYPQAHHASAKKMVECGGLLTQFMTKTQPDRENFPMRNKVVAGMSDAIVVIESGIEGGSMITAEYANMYNKDVFAFPGRATDENSGGCNTLIKRNKASLIESANDLAHFMNWDKSSLPQVQRSLFVDLNDQEQSVINLLRQNEFLSIDRFYHELKTSPSAVAGILLGLEFKGLIKALPGKKYMLVR